MPLDFQETTGGRWIDCPLSGGAPGALSGRLTVMAGGEEADFERARAVMGRLTANYTLMGPVGAGQATKLVNQVLCAIQFQAVAEAIALAERAGVNAERIPAALAGGRADSRILQEFGAKMARRDYSPTGRLDNMLKDLDGVQALARATQTPLPATAIVAEIHRALVAAGLGGADNAELDAPVRRAPRQFVPALSKDGNGACQAPDVIDNIPINDTCVGIWKCPRRSRQTTPPLIRFRNVVKRFGGVTALRGVSLDLRAGEILALLGENGAGKSTLIKTLGGIVEPTEGSIEYRGERYRHRPPRFGEHQPVAFIHQDLGLVEWMTIAENIALATGYPRKRGHIDWRAVESGDRVGARPGGLPASAHPARPRPHAAPRSRSSPSRAR